MSAEMPERVPVPDVAAIEQQLAQFWRASSTEDRGVVRACVANLVVACANEADVAEATRTLARLNERHPARSLVVCTGTSAPSGRRAEPALDAYVSTHCHRVGRGKQVCSEQVTLEARGEASDLLPETILQLLVANLPVFLWWRRPELEDDPLFPPLVRLADRLVVDSSAFVDARSGIGRLSSLTEDRSWSGTVGDLTWVRLEPWRELVASLFDSALTRDYLDVIGAVRVAAGVAGSREGGLPPAGAYLAGWLAARLGWTPATAGSWRRPDGGRVLIRLEAAPDLDPDRVRALSLHAGEGNAQVRFELEAIPGPDAAAKVTVEKKGTCPLPQTRRLGRLDEASLLCGELERRPDDPVFDAALGAAARIARSHPKG